jgi:hypothetical protein
LHDEHFIFPGLSWEAGLKYTRVELELLQDLDMYIFMESAVRGGVSTVTKRYARANNKYMQDYDETKVSSYLSYLDANNLYGWAMSQSLPISGFKWIEDNFTVDDIKNYDPNSDIGYELRCINGI